MKTSIKLITVLFVSLLILGTSCNTYEDGPKLSLRSKKARIVNTWKITEATDANDDVTSGYAGITWTINKDGTYSTGGAVTSTKVDGPIINGTWEFNDDKDVLILTPENVTLPTKWTITRLKNDELWLKQEQNGDNEAIRKLEGQD